MTRRVKRLLNTIGALPHIDFVDFVTGFKAHPRVLIYDQLGGLTPSAKADVLHHLLVEAVYNGTLNPVTDLNLDLVLQHLNPEVNSNA